MAHDDIRPTEDWQKEILKELRNCDGVILILTEHFPNSDWTDQEVGIAVGSKKVLIPIRIDIAPYGFAGKYQALPWDRGTSNDNIDLLVRMFYRRMYVRKLITKDDVINGFCSSTGFYDAALVCEMVNEFRHLSKAQINQIATATVKNSQINGCFNAKRILPKLFEKKRALIDKDVIEGLEQIGFI